MFYQFIMPLLHIKSIIKIIFDSYYGAIRGMTYTLENIKMIVDYARDRGIRIVPEFDIPGHTRSWGNAYPNILTKCYKDGVVFGLGPLNPIETNTYKILQKLFAEVQDQFPDEYIHIGGDEVNYTCWQSNPELCEYMKSHNMKSVIELHDLFMENVIPLLGKKTPIVWQDVFDENVPTSNETLIHVWKGEIDISKILQSGHKLLYSSAWYLDKLQWDWKYMYMADPRQILQKFSSTYREDISDALENIVGGEACMWGEVVDDNNIISRVWPRASAVAEKLWSPEADYFPSNNIPDEVHCRLEEHVSRMNRRGISAQRVNMKQPCIHQGIGF